MKRVIGAIMCLVLLAVTAMPAAAQTSRSRRAARAAQHRYDNSRRVYYDRRDRDDSFWDEHRDKVTVAGGAGAGAVVGAVAGGKKGAVLGALLGAGGSALYTYVLRDRDDDRNYRRR